MSEEHHGQHPEGECEPCLKFMQDWRTARARHGGWVSVSVMLQTKAGRALMEHNDELAVAYRDANDYANEMITKSVGQLNEYFAKYKGGP